MKKELKNTFKSIFCGFFILSVFFFITEYNAYRPKPPQFVGSIAEPFKEEGIHIQAKAYDKHDSQAYLNRDLKGMGFQPVQVTIQNNTRNTYVLTTDGVEIPNATTSKISTYVTARGLPKSIALKVAGFIFWPFLIPGTIDTIMTIRSHVKMKADFHAKSIKEEGESIVPYSTVNRILFIPEDQYRDTFTLYLKDPKSGYFHPFPVKINS